MTVWDAASFVISIGRLDGSPIDDAMTHYVAIVEDAGADKAIGIWFPDLPGCFSAGDDIDDALRNAHEALALYAEAEAQEGRALPEPRSLSVLKADPAVLSDIRDHMVALVALQSRAAHAAE
jgi:predicted RNase H-like HicB family nuclease